MRILTLLAALLFAPPGAAVPSAAAQAAELPPAREWVIGPVIRSRNYSVGMPLHPSPVRGGGWYFDFPYPNVGAGHVHYLTFDHGPLAGKREIVMRYRIDAAPGVRFVSRETPQLPATLSLFFQRRGDNWSARGRYADYRWYAPQDTVTDLAPGEHELRVRLDDLWTSVDGKPAAQRAAGFRAALADTGQVGFVLGTQQARGHGVYATGPARLTVTRFEVR